MAIIVEASALPGVHARDVSLFEGHKKLLNPTTLSDSGIHYVTFQIGRHLLTTGLSAYVRGVPGFGGTLDDQELTDEVVIDTENVRVRFTPIDLRVTTTVESEPSKTSLFQAIFNRW